MSTTLTLSKEEALELERLLEVLSPCTLIEIRRTDNKEFRKVLESRQQMHEKILSQLRRGRDVAA